MTESSGVPMQLRRMFTVYVLTLALCLLFVSGRTGSDEEPPRDVEWFGGPADVIVPEGADSPPKVLATPKGSRVVRALDLGDFDIPLTALLAYQRAADILAEVRPTCELPWTLLAAIGRVESNHGQYAGATLDADGVSTPQVVGVALNGDGPVARIPDTDGGRLDEDPRWDRAVGPMQFIPSTWEMVGVDGDGDGVRSIHDIDDAALAAGVYLCAGSDNLRDPAAMEGALFRYNDSDSYVALVMAYEEAYRTGDFTVETPGGTVTAAAVLAGPTLGATPLPRSARPSAKLRTRIAADVRKAVAAATKEGATTPGISASATPGTPSASATPSEQRSGGTPAASSTSGAGSSTPSAPGGASDSPTATEEQGGSTTPSTPETAGGASGTPAESPPSGPSPSDPVEDPSGTTPSGGASTPSGPGSEGPADDPSADPTPAVCETESPAADATETPSPEPSTDPTAEPTTDPDDPCKPTESPSPTTSPTTGSPGP